MRSGSILFLTLATSVTLLLTGCGEGWVPDTYNGTPYGDRTAGHGVKYVRANMIREKGPVLKSEMPETEAILERDAKSELDVLIQDAAPVFNKQQKK